MKIQILINDNSWALNYRKDLKKKLSRFSKKIFITNNHKKLITNYDVNIFHIYPLVNTNVESSDNNESNL